MCYSIKSRCICSNLEEHVNNSIQDFSHVDEWQVGKIYGYSGFLVALRVHVQGEWLLADLEPFDADEAEEPWIEETPQAAVQLQHNSKQTSKQMAALEAEADQKGYGKLYAAFGGGTDGLEACAAGRRCLPALLPPAQASAKLNILTSARRI